MLKAEPLRPPEFRKLLWPFGLGRAEVAVGVSGGGDSLVLAALVAATHKKRARYLIVDHRLRPESAKEAEFAAANLRKLGIEPAQIQILVPSPTPPKKQSQQAARELRFAAFEGYCRSAGIFDLLLAHHLEDQAETLLGRLSRGSGVQGLAAMRPLRYLPHFRLIRPLLTVSKKRLRATLRELKPAGIEAADDPSNRAEKYLRTRLRQALAKEGGEAERLAATASHLGRAADAINERVARLGAECLKFLPRPEAELVGPPFAAAPAEIALRLLEKILNRVGRGDLRFKSLFRIYRLLLRADGFRPQTLNHCKISHRPPLVCFVRQE